jgi:hypothetical protein
MDIPPFLGLGFSNSYEFWLRSDDAAGQVHIA